MNHSLPTEKEVAMESSSSNGKIRIQIRNIINFIFHSIRKIFCNFVRIYLYKSQILTYFSLFHKKKKKLSLIFERTLENIAHRIDRKFRKIRFNLVDPIATIDSDRKKVTRTFREQIYAHPRRVSSRYRRGPRFSHGVSARKSHN